MKKPLTFKKLSQTNFERCEKHFHPVVDWTETDWACALAGEVGELCNFIKKRKRIFDKLKKQIPTRKDYKKLEALKLECKKEIGDVQSYLDLISTRLGVSLEEAITDKFNEVSLRVNSKHKL